MGLSLIKESLAILQHDRVLPFESLMFSNSSLGKCLVSECCYWEVESCGRFIDHWRHAFQRDCGSLGPFLFLSFEVSGFTHHTLSELCSALPQAKSSGANCSWTESTRTMSQNEHFPFMSLFLKYFVTVMEN